MAGHKNGVVLLDNHRTELLADAKQRDALHCKRCVMCLNVGPGDIERILVLDAHGPKN